MCHLERKQCCTSRRGNSASVSRGSQAVLEPLLEILESQSKSLVRVEFPGRFLRTRSPQLGDTPMLRSPMHPSQRRPYRLLRKRSQRSRSRLWKLLRKGPIPQLPKLLCRNHQSHNLLPSQDTRLPQHQRQQQRELRSLLLRSISHQNSHLRSLELTQSTFRMQRSLLSRTWSRSSTTLSQS